VKTEGHVPYVSPITSVNSVAVISNDLRPVVAFVDVQVTAHVRLSHAGPRIQRGDDQQLQAEMTNEFHGVLGVLFIAPRKHFIDNHELETIGSRMLVVRIILTGNRRDPTDLTQPGWISSSVERLKTRPAHSPDQRPPH
jgi:hypothetical protein